MPQNCFFTPEGYGSFTRLHLADEDPGSFGYVFYNQPWGYRSWMKNGITFTGNRDQGYIGQKYNGTDVTDLVVQWSDNPDNTFGTDRMKFVFTTLYNPGSSRGAASMSGVETMRLYPVNQFQGHVGIGDSHTA